MARTLFTDGIGHSSGWEVWDSETKLHAGTIYPSNHLPFNDRVSMVHKMVAAPDLLEALEEAASDLFYQIEAKHGAEKASQYPSIVKAKAAIEKAKGGRP